MIYCYLIVVFFAVGGIGLICNIKQITIFWLVAIVMGFVGLVALITKTLIDEWE